MPNDTLAAVLLSIYRDGFNDGSLGESPSPGGTLVAPADAESQWADEPEDVREAMRYAARKLAMMLDLVALPPELVENYRRYRTLADEVNEPATGGDEFADAVLALLDGTAPPHAPSSRFVALPPELVVTRDQQEASDDEVTTLRSDARYLRGLALDAPTDEDAAALRRIATKLDLLADVAVPEDDTHDEALERASTDVIREAIDLVLGGEKVEPKPFWDLAKAKRMAVECAESAATETAKRRLRSFIKRIDDWSAVVGDVEAILATSAKRPTRR